MKIINNRILFALLLVVALRGYAQGFMNLNFESASVLGYSPGYIPTSAAFPSWAAYYGPSNNPTSINTPIVSYDGTSLGGALVILVDANAPSGGALLPIQGSYSALLEGSTLAAASTASIGQSGTIPITAKSLRFFTGISGLGVLVSFNGQNLSFQPIGTGANY